MRAGAPFPALVVFGLIPWIAIASTWLRPLTGFTLLSPWLKIAYLSTLCYYISYISYVMSCPPKIKRYRGVHDLIRREFGPTERSNPSLRADVVRTQLGTSEPAWVELTTLERQRDDASGDQREQLDAKIHALVNKEWPNAVQQYLAREFEDDTRKAPTARFVATAMCAVSLTSVLVVILHKTWIVFIA